MLDTAIKPVGISAKRDWRICGALIFVHLCALGALWPGLYHLSSLVVMLVLAYATSAIGLSLGFHRVLTHRSVRLAKPLEYAVALLGTLAMEGGPISWVTIHRIHHAHADHDGDPHDARIGVSWSHWEWLIYQPSDAGALRREQQRISPDLASDRFYQFLGRYQLLPQIALALALFAFGGWSWLVWGIFVRLVFVYHLTWIVNSAAHSTGYRTYRTADRSTNCWWVALLGWGEGWHNNHHAFPFSARHGLAWYEFDITWLTIRLLSFTRLARDIKLPTQAMRERLLLSRGRDRRAA